MCFKYIVSSVVPFGSIDHLTENNYNTLKSSTFWLEEKYDGSQLSFGLFTHNNNNDNNDNDNDKQDHEIQFYNKGKVETCPSKERCTYNIEYI